jgi:hypothetical protein
MRVKHLATKSTMAKNSATSWVCSTITKKEVEKATTDGLIAAQDSIKFPSTERIPKPWPWVNPLSPADDRHQIIHFWFSRS